MKYRGTVHHRVATSGGMDSDFSHTTVEDKVLYVVVQDDYPSTLAAARNYCDFYAGNDRDRAYVWDYMEIGVQINAILQPPITRLT
jgi:2-iminoacetate synthase ThiH